VSPPKTIEELNARLKSDYEMVDFYLAKRDLN
jgi:peroxiredoxin (alkyl hydroperoxide reductase subunit C)